MADRSKREARRQAVIEGMENPPLRHDRPAPKCHCGAPAKYEINRITRISFVCEDHLPPGL